MSNILVTEQQARQWAGAALEKAGVTGTNRDYVVDCLVHSNLRGVDTHGLIRLPAYIARLLHQTPEPVQILKDEETTCVVDAGNQPGPIGGCIGMGKAIQKAKEHGMGMAVVRHSNHYGTAAYYAMQGAEQGMLGISMTSASPRIAPWGSVEAILGNNPWSIALPGDTFPIVLDMANTVVANGKIRTCLREGKPLPQGWAMDKDGNPTTDPAAAQNGLLMPVGGYKGVGITVMVELLCTVLSQGAFCREVKRMEDAEHPGNVSHFFMAVDLQRLLPLEEERARIAEYVSLFKQVRLKQGVEEVFLPGEIEWRTYQTRKRQGIPLSEKTIGELNALSEKLGLPPIA
ncbi:MAG: Ldh family oxidoreductase [Lawsonibacter sp.]|jgi:LDH2 family malate/lactate/ureidoglycolate dehydrogenase